MAKDKTDVNPYADIEELQEEIYFSKEKLKANVDYSDNEELEAALEALPAESEPKGLSADKAGKIIPIREISLKEEREINRRLSAVEEDLIILEDSLHQLSGEDLDNVSEAIQYLKQEKEQLMVQLPERARDRRLKLRSDFAKLKRRSAKSLEQEKEELREVRQELASQPPKKLEEVLLPKGMELEPPPAKKSWIQNLREFFNKRNSREKIDQEREQENESKTFTIFDGGKIESTGEQGKFGLYVGQKFRIKKDYIKVFDKSLRKTKSVTIIGFTEAGRIILKSKEGMVFLQDKEYIGTDFQQIFEDYPIKAPKFEY